MSRHTPAQNTNVQSTIVSHPSNIDKPEGVVERSELNEGEDVGHFPSGNFDIESEEEDAPDLGGSTLPPVADSNPKSFIEVFHHPHSEKYTPTIIPLDELMENGSPRLNTIPEPLKKPHSIPFYVGDPNESAENEDDSAASVEIAKFKREVYHKVLNVIFGSLKNPSHFGDTVKCGDRILRVLFPGFLIHAVDGEEACGTCGTRGAQANHPCPRCLVAKWLLYQLSEKAPSRTQDNMREIFSKAKNVTTITAREAILKEYGLHFVKNAFWQVSNSDPYAAYFDDMLHTFDSGELPKNVDKTPRWRGLKHFKAVTSTEFMDGNSNKDILKIILPSVVDLLPANSVFVHCIRLLGIMRAIAGLRVIREDQIKYLEDCLPKYEKYCITISRKHDKNFNYPKHHNLINLPEDLRAKGMTDNYSTRPGKGFQQEVQQAYDQTNFEMQSHRYDENQEVIARIRMAVDRLDAQSSLEREELDSTDGGPLASPSETEAHWALGSPLSKCDPKRLEEANSQHPGFHRFTTRLTEFLSEVSDPEHRHWKHSKIS
ncbi:hypothetical protein M422DRAFT_251780 [Sphaerobolus stellatus SS14]|uniref:Uncharacterized protein n=1 Tax=Sphaerobolus stellatus (strain SS14) TaxID=990650 RepID=A0A0C9W1D7_SPHS4|nr:hypothetical protein M422DRAFT_251780 [Sphaerobolus stellatus SS14]